MMADLNPAQVKPWKLRYSTTFRRQYDCLESGQAAIVDQVLLELSTAPYSEKSRTVHDVEDTRWPVREVEILPGLRLRYTVVEEAPPVLFRVLLIDRLDTE